MNFAKGANKCFLRGTSPIKKFHCEKPFTGRMAEMFKLNCGK